MRQGSRGVEALIFSHVATLLQLSLHWLHHYTSTVGVIRQALNSGKNDDFIKFTGLRKKADAR
jgi:hypothetical protein